MRTIEQICSSNGVVIPRIGDMRSEGIVTPADIDAHKLHRAQGVGHTSMIELAVALAKEVVRLEKQINAAKEALT